MSFLVFFDPTDHLSYNTYMIQDDLDEFVRLSLARPSLV